MQREFAKREKAGEPVVVGGPDGWEEGYDRNGRYLADGRVSRCERETGRKI